MKYIGVDGCRKGWFTAALFSDTDNYEIGIYPTIAELIEQNSDSRLILIDMPIGLPISGQRKCDVEARKMLGRPRSSSVFPPPCREALYAKSYKEACDINLKLMGKKITIQTWNICGKMCEVDTYLLKHHRMRKKIREAHPELCFAGLNTGMPMNHNKKTKEGAADRLKILSAAYARADDIYLRAQEKYLRKDLAKDDILDALALAITASQPERLRSLPAEAERDEAGFRMEIVFAREVF